MAELNEALKAIGDLAGALKKTTRQYENTAREMDKRYNGRDIEAKHTAVELEAAANASKNVADEMESLFKGVIGWQAEVDKYGAASRNTTFALQNASKRLHDMAPEGLTQELQDSLDILTGDTQATAAEMRNAETALMANLKVQAKQHKMDVSRLATSKKWLDRREDLDDKFHNLIKTTLTLEKGIANLTTAAARSIDEITYAQQNQVDMYGALNDGMESTAYAMGLAPQEMQKFVVANKNIILSSVKNYDSLHDAVQQSANTLTQLDSAGNSLIDSAYLLTGSYTEGSKLLGASMTILKKSGDNLNMDQLRKGSMGLMKQFQNLAKMSGKTSAEVAEMTGAFLEDSAIKAKMLRMSSKQERAEFIKNTNENLKRNVMLGFSMEQAFDIAKSMANFADLDTKAKLKEANVLAAFGSQLGMSGKDIKTVQNLGTKKDLDKKETQQLNEALGRFDQAIKEGQHEGGRQFNLMYDSMKTHFPSFVDLMGKNNKSIAEGNELSDMQANAIINSDKQLGTIGGILEDTKMMWDKYLKPGVEDPAAQAILGVAGGLVDVAGDIGMVAVALKTLGISVAAGIGTAVLAGAQALTLGIAGAVGFAIGTYFTELIKKLDELFDLNVWGDFFVDGIGAIAANTLSIFGNDDAKAAVGRTREADRYAAGGSPSDNNPAGANKEQMNTIAQFSKMTSQFGLMTEMIKMVANNTSETAMNITKVGKNVMMGSEMQADATNNQTTAMVHANKFDKMEDKFVVAR